MSKKSKKVAKKRKDQKLLKKKKQAKKLGLSKFIPKDKKSKPVKKVQTNTTDKKLTEPEEAQKKKEALAKKQVISDLRKQKNALNLVERCKLQMSSSLLRLVDEKLYTSDSSNIPLTRDEFIAYHDAYSSVCEQWPTKPIDYIVKFIKKRLATKRPLSKIKFADIGCGREPLLKTKLPANAQVQSFDLVSTHADVVQANMDRLPLPNESIQCAVFSLSLMAKNLGNILAEARRILKLNGSLLIVEVTSRFEGRQKRFVEKLEKMGFKKQSMTPLKPNGYFTFFHFTKLKPDSLAGPALNIELKPCIYKAR